MGKKKEKKKFRQEPPCEMKTPPGKQTFSQKNWIGCIAFVVGIITFLVFLPALNNEFVNWDDKVFIYNNQHIMSMEFEFFTWAFTNLEYQWTPLRWISHAADYKMWSLNPAGHHLSSIIIHSLNAFLVVILMGRLMETTKGMVHPHPEGGEEANFRRKVLIAGSLTGLFFGIHPLRVESVVWVSSRKDVLYAFFFLSSLLSYLHYCQSSESKRRRLSYLLTICFFMLAVMSKATAVTLPLILILLDFYPLKRINFHSCLSDWRRVFLEKLPFFGVSAAVTWLNIGVHEKMGVVLPLVAVSLGDRALLAFKTMAFYLMKMVWPFHLALIYGEPYRVSFSAPEYIGSVLLVLALTASCIFLWHKGKRLWLAIWIYYIVMLLPVSIVKVFSFSFAHDRYTYMPSIGPSLLIGVGIAILMSNIRKNSVSSRIKSISIVLVLLFLFSVLAVLTVKQTKIWGNSFVLWNSLTERDPSFLLPYLNRAELFASSGKHREAIKELDKATEINPKLTQTYINRGMSYMEIGDYESAIKDFSTVIELNPVYIETAKAYNNRALVYMKKGDYRQVIDDLSKAIELEPLKHVKFFINRCEAYFMIREYGPAISDCSKAIQMDSKSVRSYRARGTVYSAMGKNSDAISDFQNAARLGDRKAQELLIAKGISW